MKARNDNLFELDSLRGLLDEEWRMVQHKARRIASGTVLSLRPAPCEQGEALPSHPELARLCLNGNRWSGSFACERDSLPIGNECLRLIVVRHVLDLLPEEAMLLPELTRVLAPGGTMFVFGLNPFSPWRLWSMRQARAGIRMPRHRRASRMGHGLSRLHLEIVDRDYVGGAWPTPRTGRVMGDEGLSGTHWDAAWMLVAHKPGIAARPVGQGLYRSNHTFAGGLAQLPSRRSRA